MSKDLLAEKSKFATPAARRPVSTLDSFPYEKGPGSEKQLCSRCSLVGRRGYTEMNAMTGERASAGRMACSRNRSGQACHGKNAASCKKSLWLPLYRGYSPEGYWRSIGALAARFALSGANLSLVISGRERSMTPEFSDGWSPATAIGARDQLPESAFAGNDSSSRRAPAWQMKNGLC
jgi:hypothetical protein